MWLCEVQRMCSCLFSILTVYYSSFYGILTSWNSWFSLPPSRSNAWVVCSGSVVVTAYDFESGRPGSNPEWGPIYYKASITAHGLPKPSSLPDSTLGTRAAEDKGCNGACKLTYGCSLKSCVQPHLHGICHRNKSQLNCMQRLCDWVKGRSVSVSYIYIWSMIHPIWRLLCLLAILDSTSFQCQWVNKPDRLPPTSSRYICRLGASSEVWALRWVSSIDSIFARVAIIVHDAWHLSAIWHDRFEPADFPIFRLDRKIKHAYAER